MKRLKEGFAATWKEWAADVAELQALRVDAENRVKEGDNFYKMGKESSIITILEKISNDF